MDPIAKTAYYCCGIRAADAKTAKPICGDRFASRFMNAEANAIFELFRHFRNPNASNLVRHRLIDDWIRERLQVDPDLLIVLLGAGFDTRAYRLTGGRWLEIDQPATIAIKEMVMPRPKHRTAWCAYLLILRSTRSRTSLRYGEAKIGLS